MNNSRTARFLIDRVDARLGDVEKEKKFDLIMVASGLILAIAGILLATFCETKGAIVILFIFMTMLGLAVSYVMLKEYIDDCKKAKRQNNK